MPPKMQQALESNVHPKESSDDVGRGLHVIDDWRRAYFSYGSLVDDPELIDSYDGYANYQITDIEGTLPDDLEGTLYRNGPGKFGINGHRVAHVLDGDGLILSIHIPPPTSSSSSHSSSPSRGRKVMFTSRFVETSAFQAERDANRFLFRGTFGSGPLGDDKGPGINDDPVEPSLWTRLQNRAFDINIKNAANTQIVAFGGKLLALFEAGHPYRLDPTTLESMGIDTLDGTLPEEEDRVNVKLASLPENLMPDFIGGAGHTAHPKVCPRTGNLVGWTWTQIPDTASLQITVTEWSPDGFEKIAERVYSIPGCELAPHDFAMTENYVFFIVNALSMQMVPFLSGIKGPAASLSMDGRAGVVGFGFPRPTASSDKKPFQTDIPASFSIHFSHGYEDETTGNFVSYFSGWPPSDSKDFLGAWGGFVPTYNKIPPTFLWRLEVDPKQGKTVDLSIAPGSTNVNAEHCVVHPNFQTKPARFVYAVTSNVIGDSSPPCGYSRHVVEPLKKDVDGTGTIDNTVHLKPSERNESIDCYFFGSRFFCGEPLVVPKTNGNKEEETEAYLLGLVFDAVRDRSFLAVFDLERPLSEGPVCKMWLKSGVPHGLHGCFDPQSDTRTSHFC